MPGGVGATQAGREGVGRVGVGGYVSIGAYVFGGGEGFIRESQSPIKNDVRKTSMVFNQKNASCLGGPPGGHR